MVLRLRWLRQDGSFQEKNYRGTETSLNMHNQELELDTLSREACDKAMDQIAMDLPTRSRTLHGPGVSAEEKP